MRKTPVSKAGVLFLVNPAVFCNKSLDLALLGGVTEWDGGGMMQFAAL